MHTFVDRIFAINWSHHHIQWMLSTLRCGHDAGTGSTTDWDYERWRWSSRAGTAQHCQWSPASTTAGTSQAGTGPQQAVTILCQVSQDPNNRDIQLWGLMWDYEPFFIDRYPYRCTSCVWGLLDFHQIFSFQILFFA